ncbi:MAG: GFA family protein [Mesorhizobium sp.]|uniref:GFA family protein n=1 Tax=Mesorhizobium sp. TaxID=1871066 RepID=UPI000FD3CC4C|nr:GFA family protein [Mesorhizobium sp.]RVC46027.1 GFA family protein [Mesorhizobium sp. M4B.F.Ca.ET.088.02.2.1]RWF26475.1 MAG: GFA family protein [Mesorhizobium sp.]RWF30224.1 MAG: GFA family protein [Mesorhizobium sp.]TIX12354.1 MAG: GFA family protein [Mesorhizobium sp.]TIX36365.1 MAG: GFA family protein [Mesorhizobium sp.]
MPSLNLPAEGGCRCGRLRLRITAPPLLTMACHCTGCQRMSASAYSLSAAIPSEAFAVTEGEPVIGGLHGASRHYFCAHCMSWMFTRPEGLDWFVNLRPTMLDDPGWFTPFVETWTSERLPFAATPAVHSYAALPAMEEYGALMAEFAQALAKGAFAAGGSAG